jgi:hypothetical protein
MSDGTSIHVSLACVVREHLRATMDEGKSFILIVDRKQLWRIPARLLNDAVLDHISWHVLLALAALGQIRVFLWRRVILFDHEFDRHTVKLLENESPINHRVRH